MIKHSYQEMCNGCAEQCPHEKCVAYRRTKRFFEQSNLDRPHWHFEKQKLTTKKDKKAFSVLKEIEYDIYAWVRQGGSLLIFSEIYGNGKTTWARRLLISYLQQCLGENRKNPAVYLSMFEFLDRQRDAISDLDDGFGELKQKLLTADLVVWDDLATAPLSEFASASLNNIIDTRINRGLANIYTTNFKPSDPIFKNALGPRLWNRISCLSTHIEFLDECKRREITFGNATTSVKGNR